MDELKRVLTLISDNDPQIRRYAISQLELLTNIDEDEEVMEVLRTSLDDPIPLVRHQATRTLAFFLNRSFLPPMMEGTFGPSPAKTGHFEGVPLAKLRETGMSLIQPLVERLLTFARSSDFEVAKRSIVALGKTAAVEALPILATTIKNPVLAKVSAVALAQIDSAEALEPLLQAARSNEIAIAQHALLELGHFPTPEATQILIDHVSHPNPVVRANVAVSLGEHTDRATTLPALIRLLSDREVWVILDVLRVLSRFDSRQAIDAVTTLYRTTEDGHIRATAISALGRMGSELSLPVIVEALRSPDERTRANAIESLVAIGTDPQVLVAHLTPMLKDPSNRARANAALALHPHTSEPAMGAIDGMLLSTDVWFRASAAYCLGRIGTSAALNRLVRLVSEERELEVLGPAIKSLELLSDPKALGPLLKLLDHSGSTIRAKAARVLGRFKDRELLKALTQKFLMENDGTVRATLISTIGNLLESRDLNFLLQALEKDPEPRVQSNALAALAAKGGLATLSYVRPFVSSTHNRLKANAVLALFSHGEFEIVPSLTTMLDTAFPKQFYSAIYVIGEIGRIVRYLHLPQINVHLLHALKARFLGASGVASRKASSKPIPIKTAAPGAISPEERVERVLSLIASGPQDSGQLLTDIQARESNNPLIGCLIHRHMNRGEMTAEYKKNLESVSRTEKDFVSPAIELAETHSGLRDVPTMQAAYVTAYDRLLAHLSEQLAITRGLVDSGQHSEALLSLKELVHFAPLRDEVHTRLGKVFLALKQYAKAARHLFWAHVEHPTDPEITYHYAKACFHKGDLSLARTLYQEVARIGKEGSSVQAKAKQMLAVLKEQEGL